MFKVKIFLVLIIAILSMTSAMANVAIDEDFDSGTLFADLGGTEPKNELTTAQGVNVIVDPLISDGVARGGAGAPITFTDNGEGSIVSIFGGGNCYRLGEGNTLQFGTMNGTSYVNGNIPFWGDGTGQVQAALAVNAFALEAADGTVVGKFEIAFDGLSLTDPANMKTQTYELRVDAANNEVDVWAINNADVATKVFDGLNGNNWANISTMIFVRGLAYATYPERSQWGVAGKGPALLTPMASAEPNDSGRVSVFVNSNTPVDAARFGWTANPDGHKDSTASDGQNDARVMGIKFTAGANNPLFIDNLHVASDRINWDAAYETPGHGETNLQGRLNDFSAPTQNVPPDVADAMNWELY